MASPAVAELAKAGTEILCKPWTVRNGDLFSKDDFPSNSGRKRLPVQLGKPNQSCLAKRSNSIRKAAMHARCVRSARPHDQAKAARSASTNMNGYKSDFEKWPKPELDDNDFANEFMLNTVLLTSGNAKETAPATEEKSRSI